jgi:pimeloyl-ACP methyl ester carboxylesterase
MMQRWLGRIVIGLAAIVAVAAAAAAMWQYQGRERARAQTPGPPFPYDVGEIVVAAPDGAHLAGTLTLPRLPGRHAAVVLLGVAGPNDRDLSFRGHKSFAVIADALARCNVATLRLDDRGVRGSRGDWRDATYVTLVDDALAAAAFLRGHARVDSARVGFAGLSEGAAIALLGAARSSDIAFAVLMSPPGLRGEEALREQFERTLAWSPWISEALRQDYRRAFAKFVTLSRAAKDESGQGALARFLAGEGRALVPAYGFVPTTLEGRVRLFASPWYRSQLDFDPAPALAALRVPALVVSGARDQVLPPSVHLPPLRQALAAKNAAFLFVPGANHLLMPAWTGLPLEYAQLETTVDPMVLSSLCRWIERSK